MKEGFISNTNVFSNGNKHEVKLVRNVGKFNGGDAKHAYYSSVLTLVGEDRHLESLAAVEE